VRRIIADRLLASKRTLPASYLSAEVQLGPVQELRKALAAQGTKVSVNDCVVRAAALALADVPAANAWYDAAAGEAKPCASVDVAIAVATPTGLLTPVVKLADTKSLTDISREVADLAGRARANKLKPEEFTGGSMSISNLGMFGLTQFAAILNPPQAVIMAVGGAQEQVVLGAGGKPQGVTTMSVTLSADQRVVDGEVAAALLAAFAHYFNNPLSMLTR
jgi:pyruvate dehydrogenase E2 component (dihydrolipoamide acetyltransferase)